MYNRGRLGILVKTGRLGGRESRTYMNFEELGLPAPLIAGLAAQGITAPTPVQQRAIPCCWRGRTHLSSRKPGRGKPWPICYPFWPGRIPTAGCWC